MAGTRQSPATDPINSAAASILRHDLVTPINLIVGYCDLLITEAVESGRASRVGSLRSVRNLGFVLLGLMDQVLLDDTTERSMCRVQELGRSLVSPAEIIVQACDALDASVLGLEGDESGEFRDDLGRIRAAGLRMITLAEILATGQIPADGRMQVPAAD